MTRRIFLFMVAAVVLTAALTVVGGALLTRRDLDRQVDRNFARQADALATVVGEPPEPFSVYLVTRRRLLRLPQDGDVSPRGLLAARLRTAVRQGSGEGTVETPRGRVRFTTRTTPSGPVVLARFAGLRPREQRSVLGSLIASGLVGTLLSAVASVALSRRLSRPIRRVVRATGEISEGRTGVKVASRGGDELNQLVVAFNAMADDLDAARDEEKQFVMSVSHDLRTPLTGIRGYAEALRDEAVDPATAAEAIHDEARQLERLVEDLLDLARLGRPDFSARREAVDLGEVVGEAGRRHRAVARELDVALETEVASDVVVVEADHDRVLQAISNLVENALRFTPAGGTVRIAARERRIEVSDTGPGLAPEDVPHALERYYLHRRYRGTRPVGTGVGLAIVDQLARAMNGRVDVRSAPGRGATFTLELPAWDVGRASSDA